MELTQKGEMVSRLQAKASHIGKILTSLEKRYDDNDKKENAGTTGGMKKSASKRSHLRIDPIPPFNANKIKKSPCTDPSPADLTEVVASEKQLEQLQQQDAE
jgi:RUN and FYVE domain-containing protein 1/2